jgi:penicillin-binding protein 1A
MKWLISIVFGLVLLCVALAAAMTGGLYWYFSRDLPALESLKDYQPMINTEVFSDNGTLTAEFAEEYRKVVPFKQIPPHVVNAFLAVEDARFYQHQGLDFYRIAGAVVHDIEAGGKPKEGASTITMQLARTFFLNRKKLWDRKIKEGILAWRIDHYLKKDEILWLYLNQSYLGHNSYGVEAASEKYFGKTVDQVNLAEAALLAAIPRGPAIYSPVNHFDEVKKRQALVLRRMVEEKFITEQESEAAAKTPIIIKYKAGTYWNDNAYFVEAVRRYLVNRYGYDKVYKEGLKVFTTENVEMQTAAANAVRQGLVGPEGIDRRRGYRGPVAHLAPDKVQGFLQDEESKLKEHLFYKNLAAGGNPEIAAPKVTPLLEGYKYQAVVEELDKTGKKIKLGIGLTQVWLPEADYKWAQGPGLKPVDKVFKLGDIILVSVQGVKEVKAAREYKLRLEQDPAVQSGLLSFSVRSGEIKALIGGYDFNKSSLIRPIQSVRQPGSAFKPVLYGAALEDPAKSYTPATIIFDTPIIYSYRTTEESEDGEKVSKFHTWTPDNYGGHYSGPRTMRTALEKSINTISVKLIDNIGVDYAITYARKLGIKSPMEANFSMALGTNPLSLLELMRAYNCYPTGGYLVEPYLIRRVYDHEGKLLEWHKPITEPTDKKADIEELDLLASGATVEQSLLNKVFDKVNPVDPASVNEPGPDAYLVMLRDKKIPNIAGQDSAVQGAPVITPQLAFLMTYMMQGVVQRGTGAAASALGRPLAGKTGTTNEFRDGWFVGFSPEIITGVWVGYDDYRVSLGEGNAGARVALPIWMSYMKVALSQRPVVDFTIPGGIEFARIDQKTGVLANSCTSTSVMEAFIAGTVPSEYSNCGAVPPTDDLIQRLDY